MTELHPFTPRVSALTGGMGVFIASLYPLALSVPDLLPLPREISFNGNPVFQLASSIILAVSLGILAFGVLQESGITGPSKAGSWALFLFGIHQLILDLANLLTVDYAQPGAIIGGFVSVGVLVVGLIACTIAATCIVRAHVLGGLARWILLAVAILLAAKLASALIPVEAVALLSPQITAIYFLLLAVTGVTYAFHGRRAALRRRLQLINQQW